MLSLVVVLLAGQLAPPMHFLQPNLTRPSVVSGAAFEFAPASGAGIGTACACAAVTGAKGETITWTRASTAECTTLGLATSGLTTTSMVQCAANLPRVEAGGDGVLGILVERSSTNNLTRSESLDNAAWTSTATVTADQATSPKNTATGDQLSDVSAAALQGSLQAFVTGSLTKQSVSCYVRAGTLDKATISMTGTGNAAGDCTATATGLSGTTWNRLSCSSAAAYAAGLTAVTLTLSVGTVVGDTGTVMAWGCQHELNGYVTSYVPTVAAAATRAVETTAINAVTAGFPAGPFAVVLTFTSEWAAADVPGCCRAFLEGQVGSASGGFLHYNSGWYRLQTLNAGSALIQGVASPNFSRGGTFVLGATNNAGGTSALYQAHAVLAGPTATNVMAAPWLTTTGIGSAPGTANIQADGIISQLCIGPVGSCTP